MPDELPEDFTGHDGGDWAPCPARVVATWAAGHFAENLVVDAAGAVFVSLHSHDRIDRYDPAHGAVAPFAAMPGPVAGLALGPDGALWATGGTVGRAPGVVWRVGTDGSWEVWAEIPDALFMNGCAVHPDGYTLLACESLTGRVLAIDLRERGRWRAWIADGALAPPAPPTPGANGIKVHEGAAWISVTGRNLLLRAAIGADGGAGALEVVAERLRADDFAFGASGSVYVATHPAQSVMRVSPGGVRTTIAGPAEGAVGSTAVAFGRGAGDAGAIYVTTNGGLWSPYRGAMQDAKLLRIEVGEAGAG